MRITGMPVESRMRGNVHVRFGRRLGETDRPKDRNRAPSRPNSQIQALDRTPPILPMRPGIPERATHDYKRHGTSSLYAALDLTTGKVIGQLHSRHRAVEFKKFLQTLDREVPPDLDVHLVLDNASTHKTPVIKRWLLAHPRFVLHFTPTSSSWLNLVERWFAELTNKKLRRSAHKSVRALNADIRA
jgi:transposase